MALLRSGHRLRWRRGTSLALLAMLALVGLPTPGRAHVVVGTQSLHLRVVASDLVVRARIVDPALPFVSADGRKRRPLVEARILETLKGSHDGPSLRFVQDGHEVARYGKGDEALLFLQSRARSREMRGLTGPGAPDWVSTQEHDAAFVAAPERRSFDELLRAVRLLTDSERATSGPARLELVRGATLALLESRDPKLASAGLTQLVSAPEAKLVTAAERPRLRAMLDDPTRPVGLRAGLLVELQRRGQIDDADRRWIALVETAKPAERSRAVRAAGRHPSAPLERMLLRLLADPGTEVAAEAAQALGRPGNRTAVDPLARALGHEAPRVRHAAIRGLTRIGGDEARRALERAASEHPDPATRRRARAAARTTSAR